MNNIPYPSDIAKGQPYQGGRVITGVDHDNHCVHTSNGAAVSFAKLAWSNRDAANKPAGDGHWTSV